MVDGFVAAGFERVRDAFEANFREEGEIGAAFSVVRDGEAVVDLWAGLANADTKQPWTRDSLQLIFSGTKGLTATCILLLIDRGKLDLDRPVQSYWPEFGKPHILVRHVVSHTACLPGIETAISIDDLADDRLMAKLLEDQQSSGDPRAPHAYHAFTYGWLCGELVRRIDGRSIGQFFAEEIAKPLDLDAWIGLPPALEPRVTRLEMAESWGKESGFLQPSIAGQDPFLWSIWANPVVLAKHSFPWNTPAYHQAQIPGGNGIATARSMAKFYGCLAEGGAPLMRPETIALGRQEISRRYDETIEQEQRFGVGFQLQTDKFVLGPPDNAFGHSGAGGSVHGAWPSQRVGFSYVMNLMRDDVMPDPRPEALLKATYRAIPV